ncbi:MAG: hypothetical protein U0869_04715 [Chloroflexota bacterium]
MGVVESGAAVPAGMPRASATPWACACVVAKHEERALFQRQASEPALELVPITHGEEVVGRRPDLEGIGISWRRPGATDRLRDAAADEHLREPCIEPRRIAECGEVTPAITSASCTASSARSMWSRTIRAGEAPNSLVTTGGADQSA